MRNFDRERDALLDCITKELEKVVAQHGSIDLAGHNIENYIIPVNFEGNFSNIQMTRLKSIGLDSDGELTFVGQLGIVTFPFGADEIAWPVDVLGCLLGLLSETFAKHTIHKFHVR